MSPASSAEAQADHARWLKAQRPLTGRWIPLSVGLEFGNGLLLILQSWLLARVIHAVAFADATLDGVTHWLGWVLLILMVRAVLVWLAGEAAFQAAARVKVQLRDRLLNHLMSLGPARLSRERTGEMTTVLTDGIESLENYYARYLPAMSRVVLLPVAILVVVFPLDWISGVILTLTAPLIPLFMILIGRGTERINQRQWRKLARLSAHFLDVIQGITSLKLFNASRREIETVARIADDYRKSTMAVLRVAFLSSLVLEFFATVSIAVVAVSIGFRLLWGEMGFLYGFFVLLLAPEFYLPLRSLGTHYHARMEAIGAADRLLHLFDLEPPSRPSQAVPVPSLVQTGIRLVDVGVSFAGGARALEGVNLDIRPGERLAIVGPSGAGKSTLMNLLLGFVQPSAGRLLVGEVALDTLDPEAWREQLAWVPQRPHLFAASVADNIRLGRPQASEQDVRRAATQAHAAEFIGRLPDGFQTPVGEGGVGLSGGQAQRLVLARAFFRQAPLLLLDEPTASLDAESERLVQSALAELVRDRTLVVIAHRLNTVRAADRIVLLQQGKIAAQGTHERLLNDSAIYRQLVQDFGGVA
jgi:ATP-binding cassette subfamily C protein CydD